VIALRRLLVVVPSPGFGGAEAQTLQVARGLARMGVEVLVVAEPATLAAAGAALAGCTPCPAPLHMDPDAPLAVGLARQAEALRPFLRVADAALVCCPLPNAALGALRALSEAAIPTLAVAHLVRVDWNSTPAEAAVVSGLRVGWAAVSAPAARRLEALFDLPHGQVAVVPNGLPPAATPVADRVRFHLPEGVPLLVQVGRLDDRKGAHLAPALSRAVAPGLLALAGEGPFAPALAAAGVRLLGHVADVPALLASADALVLPSRHEGAPLVLLEAARAGCPILATRAALEAWPAPEAVARIIPREAETIAAAFRALLADRSGTAARVAAARAVAEACDEAAMITLTARLIEAEAARCAA
jgi:glycosyltransferase involved in cell wall biosynthesis